MAELQMTMHQLLVKLKTIDDRINRSMEERFITSGKGKKPDFGGLTIEDMNSQLKAHFQTTKALISNKTALEAAKIKSNACTVVTIGNKTITVAEAIKMKETSKYTRSFLSRLMNQTQQAINDVNRKNEIVAERMHSQILAIGNTDDKSNSEFIKTYCDEYVESNGYILYDPNKLMTEVTKMQKEVEEFDSNIDAILSTSNALTMVDVILED